MQDDPLPPSAFIVRILDTDEAIAAAYPLMRCLRDRIDAKTFVAEVKNQQRDGYILAAGFSSGSNEPVTLAGFRISSTLSRGPHLFVDDLVTHESVRGKGYGQGMIAWLRREAATRELPYVWLDSRATAKGFYEQIGFTFLTSIPCYLPSEDAKS